MNFVSTSPSDGDRVQRSLPVLSHFSMCIKAMPQATRNNHMTSAEERGFKVTSFSNQTLNHKKVRNFFSYGCTSTPFIRLRTHQLILGGGGYGIFSKIFPPSKITLLLHRFIKKFQKKIIPAHKML